MVSSFNQPSAGQVRVVASLRGAGSRPRGRDRRRPGLDLRRAAGAGGRRRPRPRPRPRGRPRRPASPPRRPATPPPARRRPRRYTGRRITLDFHDIDIRNLLRLIADVSKKNIVVADDVTGKVTVSLRNVPWDQALDLVLRVQGAGQGGDWATSSASPSWTTSPRSSRPAPTPRRPGEPAHPAQGAHHPGQLRPGRRAWPPGSRTSSPSAARSRPTSGPTCSSSRTSPRRWCGPRGWCATSTPRSRRCSSRAASSRPPVQLQPGAGRAVGRQGRR